MKAPLLAVFADVVTPSRRAGSLIKRVKDTSTRTDKNRILRDRGD